MMPTKKEDEKREVCLPSDILMLSSVPLLRINRHCSKSNSRLVFSSIGSTGTFPFKIFLHPDLVLSVEAPRKAEQHDQT